MKKTLIALSVLTTSFSALANSATELKFSEEIPLTCGFVMNNSDLEGSIRFADERNSKIGTETPATFRVINNGNNGYAKVKMTNFSVWNESNNFGTNDNKTDVEARSSFVIDNQLVGTQSVEPNGTFTVASGVENEVNLQIDLASFRFDADSTLEVTSIMEIECV